MTFPNHDLEALRQQNLIPTVISKSTKLMKAGSGYKACCPFHDDRTPSFTIFDGGRRFHCFGCGASGDVFDFLQRSHGVNLPGAIEMLAGSSVPSIRLAAPEGDRPRSERIEEARSIWRAAAPAGGTLAEAYLRHRGITIQIPESIRFARLPYGKSGTRYPVLIALVASARDRLIGIQRTFLAADGAGKANVPKPKLSLGQVSGGAIRLAPCAAQMIVCEGLEDGLSLMQTLGRTVWVAAGASMLPNMIFPEGVRSVAVGGDNDEAGKEAAYKAAANFNSQGLGVRVFFPPEAKDFNEELKGAGQ